MNQTIGPRTLHSWESDIVLVHDLDADGPNTPAARCGLTAPRGRGLGTYTSARGVAREDARSRVVVSAVAYHQDESRA